MVSNVSLGGLWDVPVEKVSLNIGKVTYTDVPQKPAWDSRLARGCLW